MTYGFIYGDKVLKEIVNKVNRIIDSNDRLLDLVLIDLYWLLIIICG